MGKAKKKGRQNGGSGTSTTETSPPPSPASSATSLAVAVAVLALIGGVCVTNYSSSNSNTLSKPTTAHGSGAAAAGAAGQAQLPLTTPERKKGSTSTGTSASTNEHTKTVKVKAKVVSAAAAERRIQRATNLSAKGDHAAAIKILASLCTTAPPALIIEAHFQLANVYMADADEDMTEHTLRAAVTVSTTRTDLDPSDAGHTSYGLAKLLLRTRAGQPGARDEIIALLRTATDRLPTLANARHWLGHQLMRSPSGYTEALPHLASATARLQELTDSHPLDTIMLLGQAYERAGDLEKAAAAFGKGVELLQTLRRAGQQPEDRIRFRFALTHFQMCRAYIMLGRPEQALEVAAAALQIFPDVYHLHDILGVALAQQGKLAEAVKVYTKFTEALAEWPAEWQLMPERVLGSTLAWLQFGPTAYSKGRSGGDGDRNGGEGGGDHGGAGGQSVGGDDDSTSGNSNGNGGWPTETVPLAGLGGDSSTHSSSSSSSSSTRRAGRCNIDVRPGLTRAQFIAEYADRNLPVLIPDGLREWDRAQWTKEAFVKKHGNTKVSVRKSTEVAYDNEFGGMEKESMSAEQYIDSILRTDGGAESSGSTDSKYLFGLQLASSLVESNPNPMYFEDATRFAWNHSKRAEFALFFLGPAGSGVSLHEHTNAWNALVFGQKQWVLLPPYTQFGPVSLSMPAWMDAWHHHFRDTAFECTQRAGELLYVPSNWMHTTYNLQASIGLAVEVGHNPTLLTTLANPTRRVGS